MNYIIQAKKTWVKKINQKQSLSDLKKQSKKLNQLINEINQKNVKDQIFQQIQELQKQLKQLNQQNIKSLNTLKQKVYTQMKEKPINFSNQNNFTSRSPSKSHNIENIQRAELHISYIKKQILQLEEKQLAESIQLINSCKKQKNIYYFQVKFQQALGISPKKISQQILNRLNSYRQISLRKFYNLSQKTLYSFTTNNVISYQQSYGMQGVIKRRHQFHSLKQKDLIKQLMKGKNIDNSIEQQLKKFHICHHCKYLHHQKYMIKCTYRSSTNGLPIQNSSATDPFHIVQLLQNDNLPIIKRSSYYRKSSNYLRYCRINGELVCQRMYCITCLKQNYQITTGLCPFCQGICYCTRCLRNDMIVRLKALYILFGGDLSQISNQSILDQYACENEKQQKRKLKKMDISINKLSLLRIQMQKCRMICDLVKRRQKKKLKLLEYKQFLFDQKIKSIDPNYLEIEPKRIHYQLVRKRLKI